MSPLQEESGCDEDEDEEEGREEEDDFDSDESLVDSDSDSDEKGASLQAVTTFFFFLKARLYNGVQFFLHSSNFQPTSRQTWQT